MSFPNFGIKNIKLFYLLTIFLNGWFILPNWVFYFSQYISIQEIGVVEGVAILTGVIMEVPSGALSDLLGKKKTIIAGCFAILLSCLILILATGFWGFLIGNTLMFIGFSFHSGATEAFAYDSLAENKVEKEYSTILAKTNSLAIIATVISTFIGGFLYGLAPTYPFIAWIVFQLVAIGILLLAREPKIDAYEFNAGNYLKQIREGVSGLFGARLRAFLFPILAISVLIKLYQGIVRQTMAADFSYTGETFGYLLAAIMIPSTIVSFNFDKLLNLLKERKLLIISILMYIIAFSLALISNNMYLGGTIFFLIIMAERIVTPLISVIINERIDSKHRATILSTSALIAQIPYIILVLGFANYIVPEKLNILYGSYATLVLLVLIYVIVFVENVRKKQ